MISDWKKKLQHCLIYEVQLYNAYTDDKILSSVPFCPPVFVLDVRHLQRKVVCAGSHLSWCSRMFCFSLCSVLDFDWSKPLFITPKHHVIKHFFFFFSGHSTWTPSVVQSKSDTSKTLQMENEVTVTIVDKIMCFQPVLYTAVSTSKCITVSADHFKHTRMTSVNESCLLYTSRLLKFFYFLKSVLF